jgi:uncharacterized delta-60 repeat protein
MSGWRLWQELVDRRAQAAVTVAVAVASLCTVALGSTSAAGREGRSRSVDQAAALAVTRDGRLLVAGVSSRPYGGDFALARYTGSGRLDRNFGIGGKVVMSFAGRDDASARSLAVGPDGKIVVAGGAIIPPRLTAGFAIARFTGAGKLDRTFGRGGKVLTYFSLFAMGLAIQADGKVVAVGESSRGFALARYTRRGRLDRSFGRDGKVVTPFARASLVSASANAVAIQPDGKVAVAGGAYASDQVHQKFALARYNADGTFDRSFGNRGWVVTRVGDSGSQALGLVVQPDGKLVLTGGAVVGRDEGFALVRYSADGKLDPSFGRGGKAFNGAGLVEALAIQRDGKLVTAGMAFGRYRKFSLARFLEDGSVDESFGRSGKLVTDFGAGAVAKAVVVGPDGKIVAAGTVLGRDFALARYSSSGKLDGSFGTGGKVRTDFG